MRFFKETRTGAAKPVSTAGVALLTPVALNAQLIISAPAYVLGS